MKAEDMSLWYYSGGEWQWGRDEALAEVLEMTVLDVAHTALDLYSSSVHGTGLSTVYADGNGQDMVRIICAILAWHGSIPCLH